MLYHTNNECTLDTDFEKQVTYFIDLLNSNTFTSIRIVSDKIYVTNEETTNKSISSDITEKELNTDEDPDSDVDTTNFQVTIKSVNINTNEVTEIMANRYSYLKDELLKKLFLVLCYSPTYSTFTSVDTKSKPITYNTPDSTDKELIEMNSKLNKEFLPQLETFYMDSSVVTLEMVYNFFNQNFEPEIYSTMDFSYFVNKIYEMIINKELKDKDKGTIYNSIANAISRELGVEAETHYRLDIKPKLQKFFTEASKKARQNNKIKNVIDTESIIEFLGITNQEYQDTIKVIMDNKNDTINELEEVYGS